MQGRGLYICTLHIYISRTYCLLLRSGVCAGVGCMLGAMAAQPKVRKVAQRQQRTKLGVLEKPKEVKNINTEDKQVYCWSF